MLAVLVAGLAGATSATTTAAVPLFASASSTATPAPAQLLTIARPAGAGAGHVLVAAVAVRNQTSISAPSGWTQVLQTTCSASGVDLTQAIFVRAASAGEPDGYTFSTVAATGAVGSIVAYTGVDSVQPVDASAGQVRKNSALITGPSVTTTVAGALLVGVFTHSGRSAITTPTGMTARGEATTGTGAPSARMLVADELRAAAGATGDRRADSQKNICGVGQLVALRPAPDPPANTGAPIVSGIAQEGQSLSATTGSWSSSPTSFAFQWQRSGAGGTWNDLAGATLRRVHPDRCGRRLQAPRRRDRLEHRWIRNGRVRADGGGLAGCAGQHLGADDRRRRAREPNAHGRPRRVVGVSDRLRLPLGALRQRWRDLGRHLRRRLGRLRADRRRRGSNRSRRRHGLEPGWFGRLPRPRPRCRSSPPALRSRSTHPRCRASRRKARPSRRPRGRGRDRRRSTRTGGSARAGGGQSWIEIDGADAATYTLVAADVGSTVRVVVTATNAGGSTSAAVGGDHSGRCSSPAEQHHPAGDRRDAGGR